MIIIENTIISDDIFHVRFACNYHKCKGQCCIEGDAGAPLNEDEIPLLEKHYEKYKTFMSARGIKTIERFGHSMVDKDGEYVTHLIKGNECAYAFTTDEGVYSCAIEKAFNEGLIDFPKPISCHLYPLRLNTLKNGDIAVNYQKWHVCKPAVNRGIQEGIPLYEFLKAPLIRRFSEEWYSILLASFAHL